MGKISSENPTMPIRCLKMLAKPVLLKCEPNQSRGRINQDPKTSAESWSNDQRFKAWRTNQVEYDHARSTLQAPVHREDRDIGMKRSLYEQIKSDMTVEVPDTSRRP